MCEKHEWSEDTFNDIDWTAHGRALGRHDNRRVTMVKYLHDILPIGKQVHQYDTKYPPSCPSCPAPIEDREHFWTCPATSRQEWRKKCYKAILDALTQTNTAPPLQTLLLDTIDAVLYDKDTSTLPIDPQVQDIAAAQQTIGWHHMFKGRFSRKWSQAQDRFMHDNNLKTKRKNGSTWMTNLIDVIFTEWNKLWDLRNGDRHGRDTQSQQQALERQAIRELQLFYEKHQQTVDPHLKWLFEIPLTTRMQMRYAEIRHWLNIWTPVVEESYTTALETG